MVKFSTIAVGLALTMGASLPAAAQTKPITIYTAHKASIVDTLVPMFEKETGLKAEVIKLGTSDVIRRAKAEAAAPKADVIWSVTGSTLTDNVGLLEPYQPAGSDAIDKQFIASPAWTPYTAVVYVLAANTSMIPKAEVPQTWAALLDPKWKGKIASSRADNSGSAVQQLQMVLTIFGDQGWDKYRQLAKNFVFSDSSGAVPRFVADGEAPLGLMLEDNALDYVKGGSPMAVVHLKDGTAATPDGIALVKGGPNPEGGKKFIDWALSKSTQDVLVKEIGRRSVRTDVASPADMPALNTLNLIKVRPLSDFGGFEAVLKKWREVTGG